MNESGNYQKTNYISNWILDQKGSKIFSYKLGNTPDSLEILNFVSQNDLSGIKVIDHEMYVYNEEFIKKYNLVDEMKDFTYPLLDTSKKIYKIKISTFDSNITIISYQSSGLEIVNFNIYSNLPSDKIQIISFVTLILSIMLLIIIKYRSYTQNTDENSRT